MRTRKKTNNTCKTARRKLSRRNKDITCLLQIGKCGYCQQELTECYHVDHMNEKRNDDRSENLIATCPNCHGEKTLAYRLQRHVQLRSMLRNARSFKRECTLKWRHNLHGQLDAPKWLRKRLRSNDSPI